MNRFHLSWPKFFCFDKYQQIVLNIQCSKTSKMTKRTGKGTKRSEYQGIPDTGNVVAHACATRYASANNDICRVRIWFFDNKYFRRTTNIIDQMIHMLSKYADHLEELVSDRTKQLVEEQQKTDELLCRMLPALITEVPYTTGIFLSLFWVRKIKTVVNRRASQIT